MTAAADVPTRADIEIAASRIGDRLRRTPVLSVNGTEFGLDTSMTVHLKLEHLQHSGSFKARGALHAASVAIRAESGGAGVIAASGGNHGVAVAWAARELGIAATIFVPTIAVAAKVQRLVDYGAEVHRVGAVYAESLIACEAHRTATGALPIHAYDQAEVVAGAGTLAREFDEQIGDLDAVLVACGGGGLAGGIATWFGDEVDVVACETSGTSTFAAARELGEPVTVAISGLAADALGATRLGRIGWHALSAAHATSALVGDIDVAAAQDWLWDRFRLLVEPAAATPVAALTTGAWQPIDQRSIGIVLCGANTAR